MLLLLVEKVEETCPYLRFLAHFQIGADRVESTCPTHIQMGLVEWLQHLDEIWALPLKEQRAERRRKRVNDQTFRGKISKLQFSIITQTCCEGTLDIWEGEKMVSQLKKKEIKNKQVRLVEELRSWRKIQSLNWESYDRADLAVIYCNALEIGFQLAALCWVILQKKMLLCHILNILQPPLPLHPNTLEFF